MKSQLINQLSLSFSEHVVWIHLLVLLQLILYYFVGRILFSTALSIQNIRPNEESQYTAAYIIVGSIALHFLSFVVMFFGGQSILSAHLIVLFLLLFLVIKGRDHIMHFNKLWTIVALLLLLFVFLPVGTGLYHSQAQAWDEVTHWAGRAKLLYILNGLPTPHDPVGCSAPFYGLYATLIAVWSYTLVGKEAVGVGAAWSFLLSILVAIHIYEYLRSHKVSIIIAAPLSTWFLATVVNLSSTIATTMYADVHILAGGTLAILHLKDIFYGTPSQTKITEHVLFAGCGMAILLFTKSTGDIAALFAVLYLFCCRLFHYITLRNLPTIVNDFKLCFLVFFPALVVRGTWWFYTKTSFPSLHEIELEQGWVPPISYSFDLSFLTVFDNYLVLAFQKLFLLQPYKALFIALPLCILIDIGFRIFHQKNHSRSDIILGIWPIWFICGFVAVSILVYEKLGGANVVAINAYRYVLPSLPAAFCYVVITLTFLLDFIIKKLTLSFKEKFL